MAIFPSKLALQAGADARLRKLRTEKLKHYASQRDYYRANPIEWMHQRLEIPREFIKWSLFPEYAGHKWDGTSDPLYRILEAFMAGKRRIGVESATGTGKTFLGACIVLWFLDCFENSLVVTTAPKEPQLKLHIWKEIGKLYSKFNRGELLNLMLRMVPGKDEWLAVGFVAGVKANEDSTTKAQGFHSKNMLIILEETPGIPQPTITAFENTSGSKHNYILAFGNPDHQHDALHRFCTKKQTEHIRISAYDHPNVVLKDSLVIPGAQSQYGLEDLLETYGEDSPMYNSRARGIVPTEAIDALIKMEWVIACLPGKDTPAPSGIPALGVDVANSETGDEAAIARGQGTYCFEVNAFKCPDANQLGKRDVVNLMREYKIRPEMIGVDGVGVGAGTVNALKEMGVRVQNLMGGAAAVRLNNDMQQPKNLRSQMWWQTRVDIRSGEITLPNDPELHADLVTPKWTIADKEIIVESKIKIKERLGRSPNKGDAFVYWNWIRKNRRSITAGQPL